MTSQWTTNFLISAKLLMIVCAAVNSHSPYKEELTLSKPLPIAINIIESHENNKTNSDECPHFLSLHFAFNGTIHDIRLVRSSGVHGNIIPVFLSKAENVLLYNHNMGVHLCHYTDIYSSATFSVQRTGSSYILDGHFRNDGNLYAITTEGHDTITRKPSQTQNIHYIQHLSSGDIHRPPLKSSRQKRQAKTQYNVGVLIVVDNAIFKRWYAHSNATSNQEKINDAITNIRYYFSHIINEVNMRYQSIQDVDYTVNVYLVGFSIAQSVQDSPWTEEGKQQGNKISVFDAILKFRQWVNQRASQFPSFDHAILFTGNDLFAASRDGNVTSATTGQSYVGGICRYDKVSVVEDKSRFKSSTTAAHEIGHNLGAGHDGQDNLCSAAAQFIMTPLIDSRTPDNYYNIFTFSPCSKNELRRALKSIADYDNCLDDRPDVYNEEEWKKFLEVLPGQKYSYDIQCQNIYGEGSHFCGTQTYGEKICQAITCQNPAKDDCFIPSDIAAAQGTTCGDKKWCDGGHCVQDDRAPSVNPDCIYGDYRGRLLNKSVTCREMIETYPHYCYYKINRELCCDSCSKAYQPWNVGCEYGDRADWCAVLNEEECRANAVVCCVTCNTPRTAEKDCTNKDSDICRKMQAHQCYDSTNRDRCCQKCERFKRELRLSADCPYGNKDPSCDSIAKRTCYYYGFSTLSECCQTCQKTNILDCEYGDRVAGCDANDDTCLTDNGQCCETCNAAYKIPVSTLLLTLSLALSYSIYIFHPL